MCVGVQVAIVGEDSSMPPLFSDFIFVAARFLTDVGMLWFTYITPLNFTVFKGIHQSLKWNVCATHLINVFSIFV